MIKKILFSLLAVGLLTACYEDKGSYDYRFDEMNDIDLESFSFTPSSYESLAGTIIEIEQPREESTERVSVDFKQTLGSGVDHLNFIWRREYTNEFGEAVADTVTTPGYVDLQFPGGEAKQYTLTLTVVDKTTTLSYYKKLTVKTRPLFKNSLFVLHGEAGSRTLGNIEIIGDRAEKRIDAYRYAQPDAVDNPFANSIAMTFGAYLQTSGTRYNRTLGFFNEDGTGRVYEPYGLDEKFTNVLNYMLPASSTPIIHKQFIGLGNPAMMQDYKCLIDRMGRFYVAGSFLCFVPGTQINPNQNNPLHQTDYEIATGTMSGQSIVLWDSKYQRFLFQDKMNGIFGRYDADARISATYAYLNPVLDANVDFSVLGSRTPVGKRPVYAYIASSGNDYYMAHPLFIFKDEATERFYLYELSPVEGGKDDKSTKALTRGDGKDDGKGDGKDDGKGEEKGEPKFTITAKELPSFAPGTNLGSITYSHSFSTNYIFYADGGAVYRYNTSNGDLYTVYEAPAGYTVTKIKFRTSYASDHTGFYGRYLSIGLDKNGEGAVTEVALTTSGDVDEEFQNILHEGFGRIVDLQFVHDFLNE